MDKRHSAALACGLMLAGCGPPLEASRIGARAAALDPPELWRVEALDDAGAAGRAIRVCTNLQMRQGLVRANAEVNGQTCANHRDAVDRPDLYAVRCELNGHPFGLSVSRRGDPAQEFTVRFAMQALDGRDAHAVQVRRYRKLGPCPAGWGIGDQGPAAGGPPSGNALSGVWNG